MEDGKPSSSAIGVAIQRAVHQVLDDDPKILRDPLALQIVEGLVRENFALYWPQRYATASTTAPAVEALRIVMSNDCEAR